MSVSASSLTSGTSDTDATTHTTASITPTANKLVLLAVAEQRGDSTNPGVPTVTGCGLTWEPVASVNFDSAGAFRTTLTVFRAFGPSPTSGALTITGAGGTILGCSWSVIQFTAADATGSNGSGAIVQSGQVGDNNSTNNTLTITLSAFSSAANATYYAFAVVLGGSSHTADAGFTEIHDVAGAGTNTIGIAAGFKATNDTSVVGDFSGTANPMGGIAIEIRYSVQTVNLSGIESEETIGTPGLTGGAPPTQTVTLDGISSEEDFGILVLTKHLAIQPAASGSLTIASAAAGTLTLAPASSGSLTLEPDD